MTAPGKIIYTTLNGTVSGLTISPRVDENVRPLLVYSVEALEPTTTRGDVIFRNYSVRMSLFANSYSQCQSLSDEVILAMEAIEGTTVATHKVHRLTTGFSGDVFEEEIGFGTDITINITINE